MHHVSHASRPIHSRRLRRPAFVTVAVSVALVAGVVVASAPPASATPGWSLAPSPNPTGSVVAWLAGVSCPSTTSCFAVGQDTPAAVGSYSRGLVEHWNGSRWSVMTTPRVSENTSLAGVSCPSTRSCFAVGYSFLGESTKSLVEHWDGSRWSIMTVPNPTDSGDTELAGVSCPSTTSCFAVGRDTPPHADEKFVPYTSLAEHWNGNSWSVMTVPNPRNSFATKLAGVSCPKRRSCFAVGYDFIDPQSGYVVSLVEHWNGSRWSIMTLPNPGLAGVSCPRTTSCFAVGPYYTNSSTKSLVEHWNGKRWSIMTNPNPSGTHDGGLAGVSCPNATSCFAVGQDATKVEHWNGNSWSIMTLPNPTRLLGVSCASTTSCFAVGQDASGAKTLVERYA
jgi:hypothetical protein